MTDPDIERQEQLAARELARRARPILIAGIDADEFATTFMTDLRNHGWRPPLGPPPDRSQRNPDAYERGAKAAREALAATHTDQETP